MTPKTSEVAVCCSSECRRLKIVVDLCGPSTRSNCSAANAEADPWDHLPSGHSRPRAPFPRLAGASKPQRSGRGKGRVALTLCVFSCAREEPVIRWRRGSWPGVGAATGTLLIDSAIARISARLRPPPSFSAVAPVRRIERDAFPAACM
jgi:hypothetical protein